MRNWAEDAVFRVAEHAKNDGLYQQLLQQCSSAEAAYLDVLKNLSEEEQLCIEHYIAICDEL